MFRTIFVTACLLASTVMAREYNCTVNESTCTGSGMQSIVVSGRRMCCPPSATFSLNNDVCLCVDNVVEEPCRQGQTECAGALSTVQDSQGNLRCCMPGYALNHIANSVVNGQMVDVCTCTHLGAAGGGMLSQVLGLNNGMRSGIMMGGPGGVMMAHMHGAMPAVGQTPELNATEVREQWRRIGQDWQDFGRGFVNGAEQWARNFGGNMRNVGLDLGRGLSSVLHSTVHHSMLPIQRAVNGLFSSLFSSIPRPRV